MVSPVVLGCVLLLCWMLTVYCFWCYSFILPVYCMICLTLSYFILVWNAVKKAVLWQMNQTWIKHLTKVRRRWRWVIREWSSVLATLLLRRHSSICRGRCVVRVKLVHVSRRLWTATVTLRLTTFHVFTSAGHWSRYVVLTATVASVNCRLICRLLTHCQLQVDHHLEHLQSFLSVSFSLSQLSLHCVSKKWHWCCTL